MFRRNSSRHLSKRGRSRRLGCELMEARQLLAYDVVISEVMASNAGTLDDADGDSSDWIELHNTTESPVNLAGWSLSDDPGPLERWVLPSVELGADEYLIVFASSKNRSADVTDLHTDFKLSRGGEYLGLARPDGTTAHEFAPEYPEQETDISYGVQIDGDQLTTGFMKPATPGAANGELNLGSIDALPQISVAGGIYDSAFDVQITVDAIDAELRYTLDGSLPTEENSQVYTEPIRVESTTPLRVRAFRDGWIPSHAATASYIFLQDVLTQTKPDGYADLSAADYDVDPEIAQSDRYQDRFLAGLRDISTVSIVMERDDFSTLR